jgi:uncharacterized damage-inducible protein DinB
MDQCRRPEPPIVGDEKETLLGFLDFLRATILCKLEGLDDGQIRSPHDPSGMTLLGLIKHLTDVERSWFREVFMGEDLSELWDDADPERYWRTEPDDTTEAIIAAYRAETSMANEIIDQHSLDDDAIAPRHGMDGLLLRWIVVHMIEETGRHCGHADLIREAIDGQVGE